MRGGAGGDEGASEGIARGTHLTAVYPALFSQLMGFCLMSSFINRCCFSICRFSLLFHDVFPFPYGFYSFF